MADVRDWHYDPFVLQRRMSAVWGKVHMANWHVPNFYFSTKWDIAKLMRRLLRIVL